MNDAMAFHNEDHIFEQRNNYHETATSEIDSVDSERSPQFDKIISRSRHGCTCFSSSDADADGRCIADGGECSDTIHLPTPLDSRNTSFACSPRTKETEDGDEGVELFKFNRLPSLDAVHHYFTHHPPHIGILPDLELEDRSPSPSSLHVEPSPSESSMSRCTSLSQYSAATSNYLAFTGGGFDAPSASDIRPAPGAHYFIGLPIFLAHERAFCFNMQIGVDYGYGAGRLANHAYPYPAELSIDDNGGVGGSDFGDFDMW